MADDKNISPVDWYLGSYLLRLVEVNDPKRDDSEKKFPSWENTVLVRAKSLQEAFRKIERVGKKSSKPYAGGSEGVSVKWDFVGVTEVLPIYEKIEDGAEIAWRKRSPRTLRKLREMVGDKESFFQ